MAGLPAGYSMPGSSGSVRGQRFGQPLSPATVSSSVAAPTAMARTLSPPGTAVNLGGSVATNSMTRAAAPAPVVRAGSIPTSTPGSAQVMGSVKQAATISQGSPISVSGYPAGTVSMQAPAYPLAPVAAVAPAAAAAPAARSVIDAPSLDLSSFNLLFDKLDANGDGLVEADEIAGAQRLLEENQMNSQVLHLVREADGGKSGFVTREQWAQYLLNAGQVCYKAGMEQAKIDEWGHVIEHLNKEKVKSKVNDMRQHIPKGWRYQAGRSGGALYVNETTGESVTRIDMIEDKDRVKQIWSAMNLGDKEGLLAKNILEHIDIIKQAVPEILSDFQKMDKDGNMSLSKDEILAFVNPSLKKEYTLKELDNIWEYLISERDGGADPDVVTMEDVGNKIEYVNETIPELVDEFLSICSGKSCSMKKSAFMAYFAAADLWLEERLQGIIGLIDLKQQVTSFYWGVRLNRLRRAGGFDVYTDEAIVLMFKGNPGVGKTTIGRILTKLLYKIEIIEEDKFFEVQRDQLVGAHLGATEKKTQELLDKAFGGVLFVDEAYRLSSDEFGKEAVNCLMRAMTVKGYVIIVAGYPNEMDEWTLLNPGIKRRITYEFNFPNYTTAELAQILEGMIKKQGFGTQVPTIQMESLITKYTSPTQLQNFNGGVCEHILRHAIESLNQREVGAVQEAAMNSLRAPTPSVELTYQDLEYGCQHIPNVPPKQDDRKTTASKPKPYVGS